MNSTFLSKDDSEDQELPPRDFFLSPQILSSQTQKSYQKTPLDWKKYLQDSNFVNDALSFEKWDRNLEFETANILANDLNRTRANEEFFKKESTKRNLRNLATFYCKSNNVNYQQGLLELIIPFLLLRSPKFRMSKCYAYFNSFMRKFYKNILKHRYLNNTQELVHTKSSIYFCEILLKYHSSVLHNLFLKKNLEMELFLTSWIITLFSKGTEISLVYIIFDEYIKKNKQEFIFYLAIALILMNTKKIIEIEKIDPNDDSELLMYLNRDLKKLTSQEQIVQWFALYRMSSNFVRHHKIMPIYPCEILDYFLRVQQKNNIIKPFETRNIDFLFIDCRSENKDVLLPKSWQAPSSLENKQRLDSFIKRIMEVNAETHLVFLASNQGKEQDFVSKIIQVLYSNGRKYISLLEAPFEQLVKENEKALSKVDLRIRPKDHGFFGKIINFLRKFF